MKLFEFVLAKLHTHLINFLQTHAMLAGNGAPNAYTQLQDLGAQCFGTLKLARLSGVVEKEGMQITVAGMKYIRNP